MPEIFGWLEVDLIAEHLARRYPDRDPFAVRFTELRALVQSLPGFHEEPGHPVNEKILETIQARWIEEKEDLEDEDD
ncbi:MAG: Fe-S cluster assembly protein IscX [Phycisphaerales bacterium]|nr:Fe-S cluster assembly protein IscX [Phycisphaerales bacterium]